MRNDFLKIFSLIIFPYFLILGSVPTFLGELRMENLDEGSIIGDTSIISGNISNAKPSFSGIWGVCLRFSRKKE